MATKLYPPYIAGTLPAFYLNYDGSKTVITGAKITIPFQMNLTVSDSQIKGFSLRLRTASTGSYLFSPIFSSNYNTSDQEVSFYLNAKEAQQLNEGQYYKVQIAYCGSAQTDILGNTTGSDIGFYSTVGVIKCTSLPKVNINNLNSDSINFFTNDFIGTYDQTECKDQTEKVYSYEFIVYDDFGNQCYTTGEQLHHSYYDTEYNFSIDKASINNFIPENSTYSIQYKVTTINNLQLYTPKYRITNDNLISPNENIKIIPIPDNDNGVINITFKGEEDENKSYYFVLDKENENISSELDIIDSRLNTIKQILIDYFKNNVLERITKLKSNSLYKYYPDKENSPTKFYYIIDSNDKENEQYILLGKLRDLIKNLPYSTQNIDFENKYFLIHKEPYEKFYYGSYLLSRADDNDNYSTWINIAKFRLDEQQASSYSIKDFTIEHGRKYKYALQQYNIWGLYSARFCSEITEASFEDMYLYDGEKTLKIRYNPEMASFKTTLLESKSNTIGGRFPYITRNGETYYKEFPIGGLLAQELDVDNSFSNFYYGQAHRHSTTVRQNIYDEDGNIISEGDIPQNALRDSHMFSDTNIALEREFKLNVLEWLNNGKPKLFKSPYEGNYIVRLMQVSLNPIKELGRMLHNFTSTAYEIAEFNYENLVKFGFIKAEAPSDYVGMWKTYNFADFSVGEDIEIIFDQNLMAFTIQDMMPGDIIKIKYYGESEYQDIMIGITGSYSYVGSDKAVVGISIPYHGHKIIGTLNCYYKGVRITAFDSIIGMELKTVVSQQFIGVSPWVINFKKYKAKENASHSISIQEDEWAELQNYNFRDELGDCVTWNNSYSYSVINGKEQEYLKIINNFDPQEIISRINTTLYNGKVYKIQLLNIEQARFRLREIIPVYAYFTDNTRYVGGGSGTYLYKEKKSFSEYYQKDENDSHIFLVATSPFGYPHPIEELINTFKPTDPYPIFEVFYKNNELNTWSNIQFIQINKTDIVYDGIIYYQKLNNGDFEKIDNTDYNFNNLKNQGKIYKTDNYRYYDPYYRTWLTEEYNPTFTINNSVPISLATIKEKFYKDETLKDITSIKIGNGVIVELTYQTKIIDYYTEISNPEVRAAKEEYLAALELHQSLVKSYATIATSDYERLRNRALMRVYYDLIQGAGASKISNEDKETIQVLLDNPIEIEKLYLMDLYNITYINRNLDIDIVNKLLEYKTLHNTEEKFGFHDNLLIFQNELKELFCLQQNDIIFFDINENYTLDNFRIYRQNTDSNKNIFFAIPKTIQIDIGKMPVYSLNDNKEPFYEIMEIENNDIIVEELSLTDNANYFEIREELLNIEELQLVQTNEYFISYQLINFIENTPITFFEKESIKDIISESPVLTEGVADKLNAINEQIDKFNDELSVLDEEKRKQTEEYIEKYITIENKINEYNENVYMNWAANELINIIEQVPNSFTRNDIINIFSKIKNDSSDQLEELINDLDSYISASDSIFNLVKEVLKNLLAIEKIIGDKENDENLDDYLSEQISFTYGELLFYYATLQYYKQYILEKDENYNVDTISSYIEYIYNHLDINKQEQYQNGIKNWLDITIDKFKTLFADEQANVEAVGGIGNRGSRGLNNIIQLSKYYDDIKQMIYYINDTNFLNDIITIEFNMEEYIDPLIYFQEEIKKYDTTDIQRFNRDKEIDLFKYRQKIATSITDQQQEEEFSNPSAVFIFNPLSENKKDILITDFNNNKEYFDSLSNINQIQVISLYDKLIANILTILNNLGAGLSLAELIDNINTKYLNTNKNYNIDKLRNERDSITTMIGDLNALLLNAYNALKNQSIESIIINNENLSIYNDLINFKIITIPTRSRKYLLINNGLPQSLILDDSLLLFNTKVINNILDNQGIYYEYLQLSVEKDLSNIIILLEQATILFNLYSKQYNNYTEKYKQYQSNYEMYQNIYDSYSSTEALDFYNDKGSNETLDTIQKKAKQAWWKFLNLLDYHYSNERDRGMYK